MNELLEGLTAAVRRRVTEIGYELVDFRRRGTQRRPLLQVRVGHPDAGEGQEVTHVDCARVSRALEQWLDEDRVLGEHYVLEVSSPGIERPVRWPEHWHRYRGQDVNVKLVGKGRVRATVVDVIDDGANVVLRPVGTDQELTVAIEEARDATLAIDWD